MTYTFLIWILVVPAILLVQIYILGRRLSEPENMIRPIQGQLSPGHQEVIRQHQAWLDWAGLQFHTAFQMGPMHVAVFRQGDWPRFMLISYHQRVTIGTESYFEDHMMLDSSNSGSLGLFPRPGGFAQSFPKVPADQLWNIHLEGEAQLIQKFGCKMKPINRSYEDIVVEAIRIRMNHNRSQFLWPVRVLYRFFVTRFSIRNKTIAQQYP